MFRSNVDVVEALGGVGGGGLYSLVVIDLGGEKNSLPVHHYVND